MDDGDFTVTSTNDWGTEDPAIRRALSDRWEWLEHQEKGNAASKRAAWRDLGDAGLAEDRVRQNYTGRYTIELLQNAHDACADGDVVGRVWFEIRNSALLIANQGVPFTAERIISLARLGSSEKASRRVRDHLIGYKGIGFTSVFEISDEPQVISKNVSFCFDRQEALRRVSEKLGQGEASEPVPARYFPLPLPRKAWSQDSSVVERFFSIGASTVIRLPFRKDCTPQRVLEDLQGAITPELLLFAPAISSVEIQSDKVHLGWRRTLGKRVGKGVLQHLISKTGERRSWLVRTRTVGVTAEEVGALRDELWKNVRRLNVAAALPWKDSGLDREPSPQRVFAYFPTVDRLGRGILVHGDFYLDEARQRIASSGPQGIISGRVGGAAAELVAQLAESVVGDGNRLLACLAPIDRTDGYGEILANALDAALKEARIIRSVDNSRPRRASEVRRLPGRMALPRERGLVAMLNVRSDLICPGDDHGRAEQLLQRLGCEFVKPEDVASRIEPARVRMQYGQVLLLLERWLVSLGPNTYWAVEALKKRPVVQDTNGTWRTPAEVLRRGSSTPKLPPFLERPEVAVPTSTVARAFIERLDIGVLTPDSALETLLRILNSGKNSLTDSDRPLALVFAWSLWQSDSSVFEGKNDVGAIPVPIRAQGRRVSRAWARADHAYFNSEWTGNRVLEVLYGPFGRNEFLAEEPPSDTRRMNQRFEFLRAIGIADRPRVGQLESSLSKYHEWLRLPEVAAARSCPEEHPYTARKVDGLVIDRLEELLARVTAEPDFGRAIARALLLFKEPYGPDARIRCTHSAHRYSGVGNRAVGYQRWRLKETAWVPVTQHPTGTQIAKPLEAWTKIPRSGSRLILPRAALSQEDAKRLELVDAEAPSRGAVEHALNLLHGAYPDLEKARGEVRETAEWLVRRLDRAIHGKPSLGQAPPLPAITTVGYKWTNEPAIADLPGMPTFGDVPLLPPGRWLGLRRAYSLPLASTLVSNEVVLGARVRIPPILNEEQRAELLALLLRVGAPEGLTARRLAILREHAASSLEVKWRTEAGGTHVVDNCSFHLMLKRDSANRIVNATLYRASDIVLDNVSLGRVIAGYLDVPDLEHTVALFLNSRHQLVHQQGLVEEEIAEAKEILRRRGLAEVEAASPSEGKRSVGTVQKEQAEQEIPEPIEKPALAPQVSGANQSVASPIEPSRSVEEVPIEAKRAASTLRETVVGAEGYIDPNTVRFGASRKPTLPQSRGGRESSGRPGRRSARIEPVPHPGDGEPTTPNVSVEEIAMKVVTRYGYTVLNATTVRDVHLSNLGWDLEFHFDDGRWIPVEVKGSSGLGPFIITRNEWRAARERSNYLLIHVTSINNSEHTTLRIFRRLGERLTEGQMSSLSWVVDHWAELEPEEVPIEAS